MIQKISLLAAIALLIVAYFIFDLGQYFTLEQLKSQQAALSEYRANHPVAIALIYMLAYVVFTALSLPGAVLLTLSGGAIFGVLLGTVLAVFSASIGATLAFLIARYLVGDWVQARYGNRLEAINKGVDREGGFYLFSLRLVPLFPFFIVNVLMALTRINTWTFFWVSLIGMIAGTAVFANAGTQLAKLDSLAGITSPSLLFSFVLLGLFPIVTKKVLTIYKAKQNHSIK